jgi:hypothetical protein
MPGVFAERVAQAREIERTLVQGDARLCRGAFGIAAKAWWPYKTSETLASRIGCAVRTAAYEISGEREPSAKSIALFVAIITGREAI